jgi:hypothetical protein
MKLGKSAVYRSGKDVRASSPPMRLETNKRPNFCLLIKVEAGTPDAI